MPDEDWLTWYVLSAVVPFYENLAGVESKVADWSKADGFCFGNEEVRLTLEELIRGELVDVWELASTSAKNRRVNYVPDEARRFWFHVTRQGHAALAALTRKLSKPEPEQEQPLG